MRAALKQGMSGAVELSPSEFVRDQTERILEQGTTDGVEVFDRPVVLFTKTGARSGRKRYVPLMRVEDGGRYLVMASKAGDPKHPSWYFNVLAHPTVTVQDGKRVSTGVAREVSGDERDQEPCLTVPALAP